MLCFCEQVSGLKMRGPSKGLEGANVCAYSGTGDVRKETHTNKQKKHIKWVSGQDGPDNMLTSSPSPATLAAPSPSSSVRLSGFRRKKPSHHTRRPPPSRSISMFSSLKSLVTTPLSWFVNATDDSFETDDTPGKRKLIHTPANLY